MNAKIISSSQVPGSNDLSFRLEIFQDEDCSELIGEANVIGSSSFTRERLNLNRAMIKRYVRSVATRRSPNLPWFIPDNLALQYGIAVELPEGITFDMKPPMGPDGQFLRQAIKPPGMLNGYKSGSNDQMSIEEFFGGSKESTSSAQESLPQFNFPCDDAQVPVELIDADLPFPALKPVNEFISDSSLLTRSLTIWSFLQTFSPQLQLSPFPYDDWEEAITCTDSGVVKNPLLEETMLALLSTLMKDRRNLVKATFSERIKNLVLSFALESGPASEKSKSDDTGSGSSEGSEEEATEIVIFSDEDDSAEPFVKRSRQQPTPPKASALLPSIDLRRHRWYETKAMDQWHFVLASFYLEAIEMLRDEVDPSKGSSSEDEESEEGDAEVVSEDHEDDNEDSVYEDDENENSVEAADKEEQLAAKEALDQAKLAKLAKTTAISNFIDVFDLIVDDYTKEGSRQLFARFLSLSLHAKFCLLEFLIHANYDREAFKQHLDDCLEQQTDLRRLRKEIELELMEVTAQLEEIEGKAAILKAENAEILEKLDADDEISLSDEEDDYDEASETEAEEAETETKTPAEPLSEEQRQELTAKKAANKKEINSLNASLRRLRPEHTGLQRRFDGICRDCRKTASFRTFPLGEDRQGRIYWWFGEFVYPMPRILVADNQSQWLGAIDAGEGFDQLVAWLNALGIREAKLKCVLMESEPDLRQFLEPRSLPFDENESESESEAEEEEIVKKRKRGRGRPKGSLGGKRQAARERPFQRYKNTM